MSESTLSARFFGADIMKLTSLSILALVGSQTFAQDTTTNNAQLEEEVVVTGVRQSLKDSLNAKKRANRIVDAIAAEDIGKLPDMNVAEALQRVTGLQINRNDAGDGAGFQVRGISQNRVEINGRTMVSNGDGDRSNSFNSTSSALFKGIEVIKSPTADMTEGAIGATIRLQTFKPLDFKKNFTFAANVQGNESSNDDEGISGSALFAKRWEGDFGEIGALVNLSYEDEDITTEKWSTNWGSIPGRGNMFCSGGRGGKFTGFGEGTNCTSIPTGSVVAPDGTVTADQLFPFITDINAQDQRVSGSEPLQDYMVYQPTNVSLERKPFQNEKAGADINLQYAPNDNWEFYTQATYQKFDQIRPQSKQIIPLRGNNGRLGDGFVIQQFSRAAQGEHVFIEDPTGSDQKFYENNVLNGTYTPVEGDLIRGVLMSGRISPDAPRFVNNNQNKEETQKVFATGFNFENDAFRFELDVNHSESSTFTDGINLTANFSASPSVFWDFQNTSYDLPLIGIIGSSDLNDDGTGVETSFNPTDFSCETRIVPPTLDGNGEPLLDDEGNQIPNTDGAVLSNDCGIDTSDWTRYQFGGFNGGFEWNDTKESAIKFDLEFNVDAFGITSAKFGARFTDGETSKRKVDMKRLDALEGNANINKNVDAVLYGKNKFTDIERLEPGFITPGIGASPTFMDNKTSAPIMEKNWLTPIFGDQYDLWIDRLTTNAYWRENQETNYVVTEDTQAFYGMINFESELFNVPFTGNIGGRWVEFSFTSSGKQGLRETTEQRFVSLAGQEVFIDVNTRFEDIVIERDIQRFLPSANINFMLQDNMFLRFAAAKTVSFPNPKDLSPTAPAKNAASPIITGKRGNPYLEPYEANQLDISYEWYLTDTSAFTLAFFAKDIENFIIDTSTVDTVPNPDCETDGEPIDGFDCTNEENSNTDPGDDIFEDVTRRLTTPENGGGGKVRGAEVSYRSTFDFLPGFASGFGIEANYTYTDSNQASGFNELTGEPLPVLDLSENSYNFILFYEKYGFSFRAAYNFRDSAFKGFEAQSADRVELFSATTTADGGLDYQQYQSALPYFADERGQLDLSMSYEFNDNYSLFLNAINVTKEEATEYAGAPSIPKSYLDVGAMYSLGFRVNFK